MIWLGSIRRSRGIRCLRRSACVALLAASALTGVWAIAQETSSQDRPVELPPLRPVVEREAVTPGLRVPLPPTTVHFQREPKSLPPALVAEPPLPPPVVGVTQLPDSPPATTEKVRQATNRVPISLDAVLRLVHDQNGQVGLARERLQEAYTEQALAQKRWLPEISVGVGYWRHEGGIQDFDGDLVRSSYGSALAGADVRGKLDLRDAIFQRLEAERKIWQQKGELSRFTSDQLLDAATTYIDLLAARSAEAIARDAEAQLLRLLEQARNLEKVDPGLRVEVARVESELGAQTILTRRVREGASGAVAKLIYLLGLDPNADLVVQEKQLAALKLVDVGQPVPTLVDLALQRGPGVQELQSILGLLEDMRAKAESPLHWLPTLELHAMEGAFGAGPGGRLDGANRFDLGVQARWNLTELLNGRQRKRLMDSRIQQAYHNYTDVRGKITLGVQEACEAVRSAHDQLTMAGKQIKHAEESHNLSEMRLRENIKGRSPSEVLLASRSLVGARLSYLQALRDLNKAQLRLFVLTGGVTATCESR